jgi:hypothetical protein
MSETTPPRRTLAHRDFCATGRAILGPDWRQELAGTLDLDVAMVDSWAAGGTPLPYVVVKTLAALAQFRADELSRISERLTKDLNTWLGQP